MKRHTIDKLRAEAEQSKYRNESVKKRSEKFIEWGAECNKHGYFEQATEAFQYDLEIWEDRMKRSCGNREDLKNLMLAHRMLGEAIMNLGENYEIGINHCKSYYERAKEIGDQSHLQFSLHVLGWAYNTWSNAIHPSEIRLKRTCNRKSLGYYAESLKVLDKLPASAFGEEKDDSKTIRRCRLSLNTAVGTAELYNIEENDEIRNKVLKTLDSALSEARQRKNKELEHKCLHAKADFLLRANDLDSARYYAVEALKKTSRKEEKFFDHIILGLIYLHRYNFDAAALKFKVAACANRTNADEATMAKSLAITTLKLKARNAEYQEKLEAGVDHMALMKIAEKIADTFSNTAGALVDYRFFLNRFAVHFYKCMLKHAKQCGASVNEALVSLMMTYTDNGQVEKAIEMGWELTKIESPEKKAVTMGMIAGLMEEAEEPFETVNNLYREAAQLAKRSGSDPKETKGIYSNWTKFLQRLNGNGVDLKEAEDGIEFCSKLFSENGSAGEDEEDNEDTESEATHENEEEEEEELAEREYDALDIIEDEDEQNDDVEEELPQKRRFGTKRVKLNEFGENELHQRARDSGANLLKRLLKLDKYVKMVNGKDYNWWTPLHEAANAGKEDNVVALIEAGADLNAKTKKERTTPLMSAAMAGETDCLLALLKAGADHSLVDQNGKNMMDILAEFRDCKDDMGHRIHDYREWGDICDFMQGLREQFKCSETKEGLPSPPSQQKPRPTTRNFDEGRRRQRDALQTLSREHSFNDLPEAENERGNGVKSLKSVLKEVGKSGVRLAREEKRIPKPLRSTANRLTKQSDRITSGEYAAQNHRIVDDDDFDNGSDEEITQPRETSKSPCSQLRRRRIIDEEEEEIRTASPLKRARKSYSPAPRISSPASSAPTVESYFARHSASPRLSTSFPRPSTQPLSQSSQSTVSSAGAVSVVGENSVKFTLTLENGPKDCKIMIPVRKEDMVRTVGWLKENAERRFASILEQKLLVRLKLSDCDLGDEDRLMDIFSKPTVELIASVTRTVVFSLADRYQKQCAKTGSNFYKNFASACAKAEETGCLNLVKSRFKGPDAENIFNALQVDGGYGIQELDLSHNQLSQHACVELGKAISCMSSLSVLNLTDTGLTEAHLDALQSTAMSGCWLIKSFNLSSNPLARDFGNRLKVLLERCVFLETLDLSNCKGIGTEFFRTNGSWFGRLVTLKQLNISGIRPAPRSEIEDIFHALPSNIERLDMSYVLEGEDGFATALEQLLCFKNLTSLTVRGCQFGIGSVGLCKSIGSLEKLSHLDLAEAHFDDQDSLSTLLALFGTSLPLLSTLSFANCTGISTDYKLPFLQCLAIALDAGFRSLRKISLPNGASLEKILKGKRTDYFVMTTVIEGTAVFELSPL